MLPGRGPKFKVLLGFYALFLFTACGSQQSNQNSNTYLLPWPNSEGQYELQEVEIKTLNKASVLDGAAAQVYIEPIVKNSSEVQGKPSKVRVFRDGNVLVPKDASSSLGLVLYAQMEKIMEFDKKMKIDSNISWPRKIALDPAFENSDEGSILRYRNNAGYLHANDFIYMFDYSGGRLPTAANASIFAHEHFHAHFHSQVLKRMNFKWSNKLREYYGIFLDFVKPTPDENQPMNVASNRTSFVIDLWNEGLADFYSWVFTKQPAGYLASFAEFDERSIHQRNKGRVVDAEKINEITRGQFKKNECEDRGSCMYAFGTRVAKTLYQLTGEMFVDDRKGLSAAEQMLIEVYQSLGKVSRKIKKNGNHDEISSTLIFEFLTQKNKLKPSACEVLKKNFSANEFKTKFNKKCERNFK